MIRERHDPDFAQWRQLEAMGYDPDEAPDGLIDSEQMHIYGTEGIREAAVEAKDDRCLCKRPARRGYGSAGVYIHIPERDEILRRPTQTSDIPWKRAEQTAQIARLELERAGRD